MKKYRTTDKLRYQFDNLMAKGTGTLLMSLAVITAFIILIISSVVWITGTAPSEANFLELLWMGLMRAIDSGTVSGDTGSIFYVFLMFLTTLSGIFILSILISILTTGIESKLESLRKGRSVVIEKNHTVILGWSEQVFTILQELIVANSNSKNSCIVIMGNKEKTEMDDEIRERITDSKTTRIVTRQGNPIDVDDLSLVNLNQSKSIIILPEDDISVIKIILAITNHPTRRESPYNIVAVIHDPENKHVAEIAGNNQVSLILSDSLVSRIIAQTSRQPGLSTVYTELLDFDGDEIYYSKCPSLTGKTFREALALFESSTVIGLQSGGQSYLHPPMETIIKQEDEIIAISSDDDTVIATPVPKGIVDPSVFQEVEVTYKQIPEKTLLLGWNSNAMSIIEETDHYVAPGSFVTIVSEYIKETEINTDNIRNQEIEFLIEDPKNRETLNQLMKKNYDHVIIICNSDSLDSHEADANTLFILLHLRDISEKLGIRFSIVSEMIDVRNKKLAEATKVNDFIVSEKLISLMMTQVSENPRINAVFEDLFDADGSELYIRAAGNYIIPGKAANIYTLVEAAARKNEILIGYLINHEQKDPDKNFGIHINPHKSDTITLTEKDSLIVIAEE